MFFPLSLFYLPSLPFPLLSLLSVLLPSLLLNTGDFPAVLYHLQHHLWFVLSSLFLSHSLSSSSSSSIYFLPTYTTILLFFFLFFTKHPFIFPLSYFHPYPFSIYFLFILSSFIFYPIFFVNSCLLTLCCGLFCSVRKNFVENFKKNFWRIFSNSGGTPAANCSR